MADTGALANLIENTQEAVWLREAACGDLGTDALDMFFVDAGKSLSKEAVALCERCPVRADCLAHAYHQDIAGGYFGGISPSKRRRLTLDEALASFAPDAD